MPGPLYGAHPKRARRIRNTAYRARLASPTRTTAKPSSNAPSIAVRTGTYTGTQPKAQRRTQNIRSALSRVQRAFASHRTPAGLDPEQGHVLSTILRQGSRSGASRSDRLSAVETGLVESNLHNLAGGDGTSVGWRQETASSYPGVNRQNVKGGAKRFFAELKSAPAGSPGQRAQAVQRSAYPERYDQEAGRARQLLSQADKPKVKPRKKDLKTLRRAGVPAPGKGKTAKPKQTPQQAAKKFKGHYVNPYGEPTEIDQGVDYGGTGDIGAIGKGKIVDPGNSSFGGGPYVAYELTEGPRRGWTVYVAEGVSPRSGLRVGQTVKKGEVIAQQTGGIETGWAAKPGVPFTPGTTLTSKEHPEQVAGRHTNFTGTPSETDPVEGRDFLSFLQGKPGLNLKGSGGSAGITFSSSAGPTSLSNAAFGMPSPDSLKKMTPKQRLNVAKKRLAHVRSRFTGTSDSSTASSSIATLSRRHGKPVV